MANPDVKTVPHVHTLSSATPPTWRRGQIPPGAPSRFRRGRSRSEASGRSLRRDETPQNGVKTEKEEKEKKRETEPSSRGFHIPRSQGGRLVAFKAKPLSGGGPFVGLEQGSPPAAPFCSFGIGARTSARLGSSSTFFLDAATHGGVSGPLTRGRPRRPVRSTDVRVWGHTLASEGARPRRGYASALRRPPHRAAPRRVRRIKLGISTPLLRCQLSPPSPSPLPVTTVATGQEDRGARTRRRAGRPCRARSWTAPRASATASRTPSTRTATSSSPSSPSKQPPKAPADCSAVPQFL